MSWILKKSWYKLKIFGQKIAMKFIRIDMPHLICGDGAMKELSQEIRQNGIKKVIIVTDKVLLKLGLLDELFKELKEESIEYCVFDEVLPNPTIKLVERARDFYIQNECEGIVAFGGGSAMDCAKGAGARISNPTRSIRKMRGILKVRKKLPKLYAISTTSGTGSEATLAAVISDSETHEKFAVNDPKLMPHVAVLDPKLTLKLPKHITSSTGMDAMTHAVEAYIGTFGTEFTDKKAKDAVKLISDNLYNAYENGDNLEYRKNMAEASYFAGAAFTRAYVGYVHAIAHNLGGMYGVPHGLANAVILPYILEYFGERIYGKLADLSECAGLSSNEKGESDGVKAEKFINYIKKLNRDMEIPTYIKELRRDDFDIIAERALKEANGNYPVPKIMNKEECITILEKLIK